MYDFVVGLVTLLRAPGLLRLIQTPVRCLHNVVIRVGVALNNARSKASDPGLVRLSRTKLRRLCPEYFASGMDLLGRLDQVAGARASCVFMIADHLIHGDSRAAMVLSVSPLLVAAYTDELDCVAMLQFPEEFVREYGLHLRSRLLTVNRYGRDATLANDLENGPLSYNRYSNFQPFIADFLSDDVHRIRERKAKIREDEWTRTWVLGQRYLARFGYEARDGAPSRCWQPARVRPTPPAEPSSS